MAHEWGPHPTVVTHNKRERVKGPPAKQAQTQEQKSKKTTPKITSYAFFSLGVMVIIWNMIQHFVGVIFQNDRGVIVFITGTANLLIQHTPLAVPCGTIPIV